MVHGAAILLLWTQVLIPHTVSNATDRVRFQCPHLRHAAEQAALRSETFRGIISDLNGSDLIVYVSSGRCLRGFAGCTTITSTGPALARYVRVTIDRFRLAPWDLPCVLAHELHHAREIASERSIVDGSSLRGFFDRVGRRRGDDMETAAAAGIERRVRQEIQAGGAGSNR